MDNTLRFPFMAFEPVNAHGYTTTGDPLHVKVIFLRHLDNRTKSDDFDCVVEVDGVASYAHTDGLWREDETPPPMEYESEGAGYTLPFDMCIDKPIANNLLSMKEIDVLQPGDRLVRNETDAPIIVVSTKEAPKQWRLRDERDNTYFNVSRDSMSYYGWNRSTC